MKQHKFDAGGQEAEWQCMYYEKLSPYGSPLRCYKRASDPIHEIPHYPKVLPEVKPLAE